MVITTTSAVRCRVCNSEFNSFVCSTYNEHSKTKHLLNYLCKNCGSVFIANDVDVSELSEAYQSLDRNLCSKDTEREGTAKALYSINDLRRFADENSNVIDIGAGSGLFVRALHSSGYRNIFAHDIFSACEFSGIDVVKKFYSDADYSTVPDNQFDVVTMLDVLEHVPNPQYLIRQCNRILRKGGVIYAHTPVVTPIDRLMHAVSRLKWGSQFGKSWQRARTSIFHLQNFTHKSLSILCQRGGFKIERIVFKNELSWPVKKYVQVYACEKNKMPEWLIPVVMPIAYIGIATSINKNKAILLAQKE